MADIGGYVHVTGYPVVKDYYSACAADYSTGTENSPIYRQYGALCSYESRPSCSYSGKGDISKMESALEMVARPSHDTGIATRMSTDFRSSRSKLVPGRKPPTSIAVEIYPWMTESRQTNRRQRRLINAKLPGQFYQI